MAETRGRKENSLLSNAYEHIYTHGGRFHGAEWYQRVLTSRKLKLKSKAANIAGLQLGDVLAHPTKQKLLQGYGRIAVRGGVFGQRLAVAVEGKYNRQLYDGRVDGYGKVLFPK